MSVPNANGGESAVFDCSASSVHVSESAVAPALVFEHGDYGALPVTHGSGGQPTPHGGVSGGHDAIIKESGTSSKTKPGFSEMLKAFAHTLMPPVDSESDVVSYSCSSESADGSRSVCSEPEGVCGSEGAVSGCNTCSQPGCVFTDCVCTCKVHKVVVPSSVCGTA